MAKYIIDVPDAAVEFMDGEMNFFVEPKIKDERRRHYVLRIDKEDVSIYTESDRKAIEDEVREFVRELIHCNSGKGMADDELQSCFEYDLYSQVFKHLSYQEAKARYEEWRKQKEKIRVGDEVAQLSQNGTPTGNTCVVTKIVGDEILKGIIQTGEVVSCSSQPKKWWRKTGRHFDEVERLLERMRAE